MIGSRLPTIQYGLIAVVALSVPLSGWGATYPPNTWLQLGPVVLLMLLAPALLRRWPLSTASVVAIAAFLLLHDLAARWTYSDVPYDAWGRTLTGASIDQLCGFTRNQFDRLVHGMFGVLAILPTSEAVRRYAGLGRRAALSFALMFVLAVGGVYEIFEWLLAVFMDPASAEAYNGQQGDMFDAQKDMAIAAVGGLLSTAWIGLRHACR
ncbi:hypothetical protein ASE00_20125 [Sphingomonas sp. Root710]|uniref:DUF2238 domain-containing protein n=1 Tax=Sphingomonas sp. Root710 TaxID=1736594 RepID=UPI0006FF0FB7|nr:DUF2238 domain-containing protein [Sphingomonas sp. Root710]KRB79416.1 hypothetical protein ASE00_20125 [Sphingomonas sp. Root710]